MKDFRQPFSTPVAVLVLLCAILLPPLMFFAGVASSMALGTMLEAALVCALVIGPRLPGLHRRSVSLLVPVVLTAYIGMFIAFHTLVVAQMLPFDFWRESSSLAPLFMVILAGYLLGRCFAASASDDIERAVQVVFIVMWCVGLAAAMGLTPKGNYYKPVFPFSEPSHFATAFTPLLMFVCVRARPMLRVPLLLSGILLTYLLENFTLLIGCALVAAVCLRPMMVLLVTIVLAGAASQLDLSYYTDRLDLSADTANLSGLVYVQGWQLIGESLQKSSGLGVGFQQLGLSDIDADSAWQIFAMVGGFPNIRDGSFVFSKLVSEFGILGLALSACYLVAAWRKFRALHWCARHGDQEHSSATLARCLVLCFALDMFVRGNGYFTGSGLLVTSAFWLLAGQRAERRAALRQLRWSGYDHARQL